MIGFHHNGILLLQTKTIMQLSQRQSDVSRYEIFVSLFPHRHLVPVVVQVIKLQVTSSSASGIIPGGNRGLIQLMNQHEDGTSYFVRF